MTATDLARTLFNAFEAGPLEDARAVLADDFSGCQNGGPPMTRDQLLEFSAAVSAVVPDFRYEDIVCVATATGFVEEHSVCGTLPDGQALRIAACVVAEVEGGRIQSLREYLDTRAAMGLLKALG
ncbi:MAG: nuclear transport factor 2 family protein [Pseudomonadota bacterium]